MLVFTAYSHRNIDMSLKSLSGLLVFGSETIGLEFMLQVLGSTIDYCVPFTVFLTFSKKTKETMFKYGCDFDSFVSGFLTLLTLRDTLLKYYTVVFGIPHLV